MNKRKLCWQIAACLILSGAAFAGSRTENKALSGGFDRVSEIVMHQLSFDEVKSAGIAVSARLAGAPAKVVSAITEANNASKYGTPIDEKSDSRIKQVHASAGGMVLASGWDEKIGLYIKIRHEDAVSVYGNLSDIGVVESERVQRGEIIGSFKADNEKEFYYDLQENL